MRNVDILIQALKNLGGKARYSDIYDEYSRLTGDMITDVKKATIRETIEDHSSDSKNYKGKEDYFYSVYGKGRGWWGLRS